MPPEELARLGRAELIPGMPVEVYIQTTIRTVAFYLVRPFQDQIAKAFRENKVNERLSRDVGHVTRWLQRDVCS